jgi:hypothetical protein
LERESTDGLRSDPWKGRGQRAAEGVGGGVGRIDQTLAQAGTIVRSRVRHLLAADEAVTLIDADVRLLAELGDREIALDRAVGLGLALAGLEGP